MEKRDDKQIIREFELRRWRQLTAATLALVLLLGLAMLYKHIATNEIYVLQGFVIAAFIGFSYYNWRCPLCKKYLGHDIGRHRCRRCGSVLR